MSEEAPRSPLVTSPEISPAGSDSVERFSPSHHKFTQHGFGRLEERTNFHDAEIDHIIENGLAALVGREEGGKEHWMAWSPIDQETFVFVRNGETKEVITVLPLEYYRRGRLWRGVDDSALGLEAEFARQIVETRSEETVSDIELRELKKVNPRVRLRARLIVSMENRPETALITFHIPLQEIVSIETFWESILDSRRFKQKTGELAGKVSGIESGLFTIGKREKETGMARFFPPELPLKLRSGSAGSEPAR